MLSRTAPKLTMFLLDDDDDDDPVLLALAVLAGVAVATPFTPPVTAPPLV